MQRKSRSRDKTPSTSPRSVKSLTSQNSRRAKSAPPLYNEKRTKMFDPVQNTHLWTMWRIAVTERIVNEGKTRNVNTEKFSAFMLRPPLRKYIHVTNATHKMAYALMGPGDRMSASELLTGQFIYFGLPRIVIKNGSVKSEQNHDTDRHIP